MSSLFLIQYRIMGSWVPKRIAALVIKVPFADRAIQWVYRILPMKAFRAAKDSARIEVKLLSDEIRSGLSPRRFLLLAQPDHRNGLGDILIFASLANYLAILGVTVTIMLEFQASQRFGDKKSIRENEALDLLTNLLDPKVQFSLSNSIEAEKECAFMFERYASNRTTPFAPALFTLSLLYKSKVINPLRYKPSLPGANVTNSRQISEAKIHEVRKVGFHVRSSDRAVERNPDSRIVRDDLVCLLDTFPNAQIVWFGDRGEYEKLLTSLCETNEITERLTFQESKSYKEAIAEITKLDFWFQRFGGGIGASVLFSKVPYLIVSSDVPATRLYMYQDWSVVPWAGKQQRYVLLILMKRISAKFLLRAIIRFGTKRH